MESDKEYEVIRTQSSYELHTDGTISINELYEIYLQAFNGFITTLNQQETNNNIPVTADIYPPPLSEHLADLTDIANRFEQWI